MMDFSSILVWAFFVASLTYSKNVGGSSSSTSGVSSVLGGVCSIYSSSSTCGKKSSKGSITTSKFGKSSYRTSESDYISSFSEDFAYSSFERNSSSLASGFLLILRFSVEIALLTVRCETVPPRSIRMRGISRPCFFTNVIILSY